MTIASRTSRCVVLMLGALLSLFSCSDQRPLGPSVHPANWLIPSSPDFHGRRITSDGIEFCKGCHGGDLRGGNRAPSCYVCHGLGTGCAGCHGNLLWAYAPPPDLSGNTESGAIGVGAHLEHVLPSTMSDGYDCIECHIKPTELASPGHQDDGLPAEITFGDLSKTGGADPSWDRSVPSCSGVYCHGATLEAGATQSPEWTDFPPEAELCGICHPLEEMSQGSHEAHIEHGFDCFFCHEGYGSDPERVVTSSHVDGTTDVNLSSTAGGSFDGASCVGVRCHGAGNASPVWGEEADLGCTGCHGGGPLPAVPVYSGDVQIAPPTDLSGSSDSTSLGVGAHRSHLVEGEFRTNLECEDCHIKPGSIEDPDHIDSDLIAEISFGDLAKEDEADPVWDRGTMTCSGTYCHGATHEGGSLTVPDWTIVNPIDPEESQAFCGSCHGIPPHDDRGACNLCHGNVVAADTTIIDSELAKSLHINGETDF